MIDIHGKMIARLVDIYLEKFKKKGEDSDVHEWLKDRKRKMTNDEWLRFNTELVRRRIKG